MNILVTGASGFVGNHVVKELADHGHKVIGTGSPNFGALINHDLVSQYLELDLTDPAAADTIDFADISAVLHLAGMAAVGASFANPLLYINTNIGMQVNLFEAALKQNQFPRFLIVSSGSLYDASADLPLTESSATAPDSPYAVSKLGQEQMAAYYHKRGFQTMIARPFNHIGPGQNEGFIVPDLTKQIVKLEKAAASELLVGNLSAERDYTDVRDIARAYRLLLESGKAGELYNICSGVSRSGQFLLDMLLDISGATPTVKEDPARMRPSDNPVIYGSYQKLQQDTGWKPEIDIQTTLQDVITDWRSRPAVTA